MIKIRIKFFAKIKEDIGHSKITLCLKNPHKVEDIIKIISKDKKTSCLRSFTKSSFSPFKMWLSNNSIATPIFKKKNKW